MDTAAFKRNVFRTISVKTAKAGLRYTARNTPATNVLHGIIGLNTEVGGLMAGVQPFLLGFQLNDAVLQNLFQALGGVSYYAVLLAKTLKVKIPGSGKKVHLHSLTKTEAILQLNALTNDLLYHATGVFNGKDLDLVTVASNVEAIIDTIWPLTYDMLGVTVADVFADYSERLAPGFPAGLFSTDDVEYKAALTVFKAQEKAALDARAGKAPAEESDEDEAKQEADAQNQDADA